MAATPPAAKKARTGPGPRFGGEATEDKIAFITGVTGQVWLVFRYIDVA